MGKGDKILQVLRVLEKEEVPEQKALHMDRQEFGEILEVMESQRLITGTAVLRAGKENLVLYIDATRMQVTGKGAQYLDNNK